MNETRGAPRFFQSIQVKYALTYLVLIGAVLILMNTYPVLISQDSVFRSKTTALQSQVTVIASALAEQETLTADNVGQVMEVLGPMGLTRIVVTDPAGLVLYDSAALPNEEEAPPPEAGEPAEEEPPVYRYALYREVVRALEGYDKATSRFAGDEFRSSAAGPVVYRNMIVGAVYVYEADGEQAALLLGMQSNLRGISLLICAMVLVMSVLFSKALTSRIGTLLRAIRIVREGEYNHRVTLKGRDELTQLADEFNQLTDRLQTTEEVRRRFVSDASHELKTPLASIRLLTDSILQSQHIDEALAREFVGDIGEEADRLTRITEKLLTLTRLDTAPPAHTGPVDVAAVVEKVRRMLVPLARAGEVDIRCRLEEGCVIRCTEDDLYQIAFNLMENAVKYNLPGGSVTVTLRRAEDTVELEVADTGVGIPQEDLDKVFRRFYRVDKARSRAAGGTGLGLSIVRDTVLAHGGTVSARAGEAGGSVFLVTFPAWREGEEP